MSEDRATSLVSVIDTLHRLHNFVDAHIVIVGAAAMDQVLERTIKTKMIKLPRDLNERIFSGYGPLSNFASKIDLIYALNVIPKSLYDDLRAFNRLRVRFAHTTSIINFQDDDEAKRLIRNISGLETIEIKEMKNALSGKLTAMVGVLNEIYLQSNLAQQSASQ